MTCIESTFDTDQVAVQRSNFFLLENHFMSLLSLNNITFAWGGPLLFDEISLEIHKGQRIGFLGRNGTGKSTLMKILAGELEPDDGTIRRANGLNITRLIQEVPQDCSGRIEDVVAEADDLTSHDLDEWQVKQAVERILSQMNLEGETRFETLSSGMKRRVLLAKSLVHQPDILLLDEPTNHLDIDAIRWLERFLKGYEGTLLFVTHDRVFLQSLATRIIELDRGKLYDWSCDYDTFLKRKQDLLEAEEKQNQHFDRKLAEEEVWIRKGIKARRTRNEGRVRALEKMRSERSHRRERIGNVRMEAAEAEKSGQLVIKAKNISFAYDEEPVINDFSVLLSRGDKIGIIGKNGSGKSTLLKLLLGELKPTSGTIQLGTKLEVTYFDQLREQIDEEKTVVENVGEGQEMLTINGKQKHVYGYLQDFLFTPERARRPARYLSGGERNRLLLAQLFKRSSNLLVLDEPTNDLDAETLELLEELVSSYVGTLLIVSHDRAFLNNVVTSTLVFEGEGGIKEYAGGYDDYIAQKKAAEKKTSKKKEVSTPKNKQEKQSPPPVKLKKLTFKEQREIEALPQKVNALEESQTELHRQMADPDFFKQPSEEITKATTRTKQLEQELSALYKRWEELETRV